jgi:hypothetical protein
MGCAVDEYEDSTLRSRNNWLYGASCAPKTSSRVEATVTCRTVSAHRSRRHRAISVFESTRWALSIYDNHCCVVELFSFLPGHEEGAQHTQMNSALDELRV